MTRADVRFHDKVAVVTGGGDAGDLPGVGLGIGATIAGVLASQGCAVGVLDRNGDLAQMTVDRIQAAGGRATAVAADVSVEDDCRAAVEAVRDRFDGLDILVNNVGIESFPRSQNNGLLKPTMITDMAESDWDRTMAVNVKGMMFMAKHTAPHFRPGASIVCIGATGALRPPPGTAAYATSKAAVLTLAMSMAVELAPVRVNCVSPGQVWTPAVLRKLSAETADTIRAERVARSLVRTEGTAMDIANAVSFLASDEARWITGQNLCVDGGSFINDPMLARISGWDVAVPAATSRA